MNEQRNLIMAFVLSALVLVGWTVIGDRFFPQPKPTATQAAKQNATTTAPAASAPIVRNREAVIGDSPRIQIESPKLKGSIALKGARIDDLVLISHRTTVKKNSGPVQLLSPGGSKLGYFAGFGWSGEGLIAPAADTLWKADGAKLTPTTPITLTWDNGQGQTFAIRLSLDKEYMFTVDQTVTNAGAAAIGVRGYGYISRSFAALGQGSSLAGPSHDVDSWTMHVGPIGTFNGATNYDVNYSTLDEAGDNGPKFSTKGGWIGFGDTYWLTALAPANNAQIDASFRKGGGAYQAEYALSPSLVGPGKSLTTSSHFFAGAKEITVLDGYMDALGIPNFGNAIDWGWFKVFAKPIFYLLDWFFKLTNNFGVAIILLTLTVKLLMFPIAQKQFASMAAMRVVQPKIKAMQERYKDDKPRQQQELMALYKTEKINPAAGCLPVFIQIPIFYALYKVLLVAIEMRHQPFALWIKDLSAPDPLTPVNLFGLLNFTPPSMIALGVLPILLGITMYLQFKLNPAPVDPVQAQVFSIMPWILMFVMAPFAAGLQLYWVVNNTLTILQQKWLYSRHPGMAAPVTK
ncbi:MAG: membrane protein insertase YidC [Chakrabartia sp.]